MLNTSNTSSYERCSSPISSLWTYAGHTSRSFHLSCASCSLRSPELDTALQLCLQRAEQRRITSLGLLTTQCSPWSCWRCLVQIYTAGSCCPLGPQGCSLQSCFPATQGISPSCLVPLNVRTPMWCISHSFQFCTICRESTSHLPGTTQPPRILQGIKWYKCFLSILQANLQPAVRSYPCSKFRIL